MSPLHGIARAGGGRAFLGIRHDMTEIRHVATGICRDPLRYTKIAPMAHCAIGAIWAVMHVYCTYFFYSYSLRQFVYLLVVSDIW